MDMDKKCCGWDDLKWTRSVLMHGMRTLPWKSWWKRRKKVSRYIHEDRAGCRICMPANKGKITDAGYDELSCICAKISAGYDFVVEADVTVHRFLDLPGPNNQEGFGLFLRENIERHPSVGLYYSNMAAVGGYYGRLNFFGRSGLSEDDISRVRNFFLYRRVNCPKGVYEYDPLHYRIMKERPVKVHLRLCRQGERISVRMTGPDGTDLLAPAVNGGPGELSGIVRRKEDTHECAGELSGSASRTDENAEYTAELKDAFPIRPGKSFYIGFFAARGTDIEIHKGSFRLTVTGKAKSLPFGTISRPVSEGDPYPHKRFDPQDYSSEAKEIYYASPEGKPSGYGSKERPMDIATAIERCGFCSQIVLMPGKYVLTESVVIGQMHSGKPGMSKRMSGSADGRTVLDFGGTDGSLSILGDYWLIEDIHVTNGYGIRIEGSCNWLRGCSSFGNYETGILIRHHDNASDRRDWPCHNLIEDCCSYENRDVSESNADGFACKVASGAGNVFQNCVSFLNADDGFDLFTKNCVTGPVTLRNCRSFLNGFKFDREGGLESSGGNGNGFKLGGSGLYVEHVVSHCTAEGNRQYGFTNNSNPYMLLNECRSLNNGRENIHYDVYEGSRMKRVFRTKACVSFNEENYRPEHLLDAIMKEVSKTGMNTIDRNG